MRTIRTAGSAIAATTAAGFSGATRHDGQRDAAAVARGAGVEKVLRRERIAGRLAAQTDTENAPGWAGREEGLREGGEVGAGEGAETEMDDAGAQHGAIDVRSPHRPRQTGQRVARQTHHRHTGSLLSVATAVITPGSSARPRRRPTSGYPGWVLRRPSSRSSWP